MTIVLTGFAITLFSDDETEISEFDGLFKQGVPIGQLSRYLRSKVESYT